MRRGTYGAAPCPRLRLAVTDSTLPAPKPTVGSLKLVSTSKGSGVSFTLSGPGSIRVQLQRASTQRKLEAGTHSVVLPVRVHGHLLPPGTYRAVVTPIDPAGHKGTARTLKLVLRRR